MRYILSIAHGCCYRIYYFLKSSIQLRSTSSAKIHDRCCSAHQSKHRQNDPLLRPAVIPGLHRTCLDIGYRHQNRIVLLDRPTLIPISFL